MKKKLKALLLCAGIGSRLRPLTNKKPKCLVEIGGKPLLGIWLNELERIGVEEVLINTHHLSDQVKLFVDRWKSNSLKINVHQKTCSADLKCSTILLEDSQIKNELRTVILRKAAQFEKNKNKK